MQAKLTAALPLTGGITAYHFQPEQPLDHIAGQYIEMAIPHDHPDIKGDHRWFTLSSSPSEDGILITMRHSDSSFKQALQQLEPGDDVLISQPQGDFVLPLNDGIPLIWVAAGIGITPFRSMAKWLADNQERREITLFHGVSTPDEALFSDIFELAGISDRQIIASSDGKRLSPKLVIGNTAKADAMFYISGPETFVGTFGKELQSAGIQPYQIVTDAFLGYH